MALMKCKECKKEISTSAEFCPHCGYVYKSGKTSTKKVIGITIATLIVAAILFLAGTYIIFDWLPVVKINKELKKYYGTWVLVEDNFKNVFDNSDKSYTAAKEIVIDKNNIDSQVGGGCGFNHPENGFSITTYTDDGCGKEYYLITSLKFLTTQEGDVEEWEDKILCFDLKDDMLVQKKCYLNDNTVYKNQEIKYKLKK